MQSTKHILLVLLTLFSLNACSSNPGSYTVMTYNIRHGVGLDRVLDLDRIVRVIKSVDPDIIVLNEVDHGTLRSFSVQQTDSLGRSLGMQTIFGRSIDYDGGEYGNALLTKYPVIQFRVIDLSVDSLREGRSVFISSIDLGQDTLVIMGTHLGLSPEERYQQVERIIQNLPDSKNLILAGDLNFEPESDTYRLISDHLVDGVQAVDSDTEYTFPADKPDSRIDYIFISTGINPLRLPIITVEDLTIASDHRPQILEFVIR